VADVVVGDDKNFQSDHPTIQLVLEYLLQVQSCVNINLAIGVVEGPALVEDPAWLEGPALEDPVQPLELAVDVH